MKSILAGVCLAASCITACLAAPSIASAADSVFPYKYQQTTLPNGLRVIEIPMPSGGLVSYWSIVRTGSRDEVEPGKSGFAHFFEHMMFRGTKKNPGTAYDRIVNNLGADSNAFTSDDVTAFHLTFAKEDLPRVVEIEADRFQNLSYGREAFQTEAGAVYGEYRKDQTEPFFMLEEKLRDTAFDRHTYKHTTMGFEADVKNLPHGYEYSLAFHKRFYRPENVVLVIAGDFDPAATLELIKKNYGDWKPGYVAPKIVAEPPQTAERKTEVAYPGKTLPITALAYHGDAFEPNSTSYVAARLLMELAFGSTSDVYKKLVLDKQTCEYVGADAPINRDAPLFQITALVKKADDLDAVQKELDAVIAKFQKQPVSEEQLDRVKRHEKYNFLMDLDEPAKVGGALVPFIAATGRVESIDELYHTAEKVTPEDVMEAARKYLDPKRRTVIVLKGVQE